MLLKLFFTISIIGLSNASNCPPLISSDSYDVSCFLNKKPVSCENPAEGTVARSQCKPFHISDVRPIISCQAGVWDKVLLPCVPDCGIPGVNEETVLSGSSENIFPWVVSVYKKTSTNSNVYLCDGTIISKSFILTAAHCVSDVGSGAPHNEELLTVVVGNQNRNVTTHNIEESARKMKVRKIFVHEDYKGRLLKYRDDIALIQVDKLLLGPDVLPACIDWDNKFEELDFTDGHAAVVSGLDDISENVWSRKLVLALYKSTETCRKITDLDFFSQYFYSGKFCAGVEKKGENSVCRIMSGSGIYFKSTPEKYYARGLASVSPRTASFDRCFDNRVILYTKISKYLPWLEGITRRV